MNKIGKIASFCLLTVIMVVAMAACGNKQPSPDVVAQKIDNKEALSQDDYSCILDYCAEYAKKAQPLFDVINTAPTDSTTQAIDATSQLASLVQEYKYLDMFRDVVYNLPINELDESNQKKVDEYAKYQGFPLPEGSAQDLVSPDVTGVIEDMPDSSNSQVIAVGDGEAVNINVN